ncbi:glycoside hydrolase family 88/105 protein [Hufsiella ginkgonis]|uniref:Glycosyl hydrolase n=1 Tax=Hufsiella ginkgonis TaxID=2695274 RepID=A0A7K1Y3F6_9SPHI|nr:glycoside hydrolase family 88 protein [Hufsiella ginkgonis]MXV17216.1 glycosyl hydrolase [Hufsiella ginkgonis]
MIVPNPNTARRRLVASVLLLIAILPGATAQENEALVRKIADQVIRETKLGFEGADNKQFYASAAAIPEGVAVKYASSYTGWHYTHGVLNMSMVNLGNYLNEPKYTNYAADHVAFGFANYETFKKRFPGGRSHVGYPYGEMFTMEELDDFGAMSASILALPEGKRKDEYLAYVKKAAMHLTEERLRLKDGTFVRKFPHVNTLWADDLYMSVPFLARMGKLTGEKKYFDDAIKQVVNFDKYLWDPQNQLYWHAWYSDVQRNGVAHWGRCNGWIMIAQVHLLDLLPANHPARPKLLRQLEKQVLGIAHFQSPEGLWHQVLDRPDSYLESSASAMFVYGIAHAVNQGWIGKSYASIAKTGWDGLKKYKINELGQLKDICVGTGIQDNMVFYYTRPVGLNEKHGTGPLIDAGVEILKFEKAASK